MTTSRPERVASRIVVRSAAPQVDCLVVVIGSQLLIWIALPRVFPSIPSLAIGAIPYSPPARPPRVRRSRRDRRTDRRARCPGDRPCRQPGPQPPPLRAPGEADRGEGEGRPEQAGPDPSSLDRRGRRDRGGGPPRARLPSHD